MRKKIASWTLLIVLAIALICIFGINSILHFSKSKIEALLSKELAKEVKIERATIHFIPSPGVKIDGLSIGSSDPAKASLQVKSFSANLNLAALFSGSIQPSTVNVEGLKLKEPKVEADQIQLSVVTIDTSKINATHVEAEVTTRKTFIVDGIDNYKLAALNGPVIIDILEDNIAFAASIQIADFGYSDGETIIENVNASLNDIKGSIPSGGDVKVTVNLDAKSVVLSNPSIHIAGVKKVSAPIVVKVPNAGGYEVSGPVTIEGAKFTTVGKNISEVNSKIEMLVSSPLKEFTAKKIAFTFNDKPGTLVTKFSMTPTAYIIGDTVLTRDTGTVMATTTLARGGKKDFSGYLKVKNLNVTEILKTLTPGTETDYGGVVNAFSAKFQGRTDKLRETLEAEGDLAIGGLLIKGKDVETEIVKAAKEYPILAPMKISEHKEDPPLLAGKFAISNEVVKLEEFKVPFKNFNVETNGEIALNKKVDLSIELVFLQENAAALGLGIAPLEELFGNIGRATIPLTVKGTLPEIKIASDNAEWAKRFTGISLVEAAVKTAKDVGEAIVDSVSGED